MTGLATSRTPGTPLRTALGAALPTVAALAVAAAALAGCSTGGKGTPVWTAGSSASGSATSTPTPAPTSTGSASAVPGSTAAAWKVFTDPAKTVSFEVPQDWI